MISKLSHTGGYCARIPAGAASYAYQIVPVTEGDSFLLLASLGKASSDPGPYGYLFVNYYDDGLNFKGTGLLEHIVPRLGDATDNGWTTVYFPTTAVPAGATKAYVVFLTISAPGSADLLVDDVALLAVAPSQSADSALAYGSLYDGMGTSGTVVDFINAGPALHTVPNLNDNSITVLQAGVYQISATVQIMCDIEDNQAGGTFAVHVNSEMISPTFGAQPYDRFARASAGITVQRELAAGDVLTIQAIVPLLFSNVEGPSLSVLRIR